MNKTRHIDDAVADAISRATGRTHLITGITAVYGGDINQSYFYTTNHHTYFVKMNREADFPGMFEKEAMGLKLLYEQNCIRIPVVITAGESNGLSFLILEKINPGRRNERYTGQLGQSLAALHRVSNNKFGLDHNNYIGSLPQSNKAHERWNDFFISERIVYMMAHREASKYLNSNHYKKFDALFARLGEIFPPEPPSLLHGDLWSGNCIDGPDGFACLIDPAVYFGHREMDLGMTRLFGGFGADFYDAYNNNFPLEKGWEERLDICNLYPLLVHLILFGPSYLGAIERTLKKF